MLCAFWLILENFRFYLITAATIVVLATAHHVRPPSRTSYRAQLSRLYDPPQPENHWERLVSDRNGNKGKCYISVCILLSYSFFANELLFDILMTRFKAWTLSNQRLAGLCYPRHAWESEQEKSWSIYSEVASENGPYCSSFYHDVISSAPKAK